MQGIWIGSMVQGYSIRRQQLSPWATITELFALESVCLEALLWDKPRKTVPAAGGETLLEATRESPSAPVTTQCSHLKKGFTWTNKISFKNKRKVRQTAACCVSLVLSNSLQRPARFLCPWDSPGKSTGVVAIPFSRDKLLIKSQKPKVKQQLELDTQ